MYFKKSIQPFGFFFPGSKFSPDTNSNLECLRRILDHIGPDNLPETLFIQLDNTCKDNKNWIFFSYCAYLVLSGYGISFFSLLSAISYVKRIEIYFLPVGHTHGQIDQMFSRLSVFLKRLPAKSLPELQWSLEEAYFKTKQQKRPCTYLKKKPITQVIDTVTDVNTWLDGLLDLDEKKKWNLKDSLAYQFLLNDNLDGVYLKSKILAANTDWKVNLLVLYRYLWFLG